MIFMPNNQCSNYTNSKMNVKDFYNKITYPILPKPINWAKGLLPYCKYQPNRILHAGCATGTQTRSLAYTFPDAEILALDFAESSLKLAVELKKDPKMANVTFRKHDLTNSLRDFGKFDLVLSYGVLHHIPQVDLVMQNISQVMSNEESAIFIFLYGKYGRANIARYQAALSIWQKKVKELSYKEVQKALWSVAKANGTFSGSRGWLKYLLVKLSPYWKKVWISSNGDTYLNPYVKYYDIEEILALLNQNGFVLGDFIYRKSTAQYGFPQDINRVLRKFNLASASRLDTKDLLSIADRLTGPKEYEFVCFPKQEVIRK